MMILRRILPWLGASIFLAVFFFYPLTRILGLGLDWSGLTGEWAQIGKLVGSRTWFTFSQAVLSTLLTLLVGLPGAYLFAHYEFPGKKLLKALTAVPFMLPTVVVAAGFNALLGPRGWVNVGLMDFFHLETAPLQVMHTLGAILLAHVFYNTTIVLRLVGNAWERLDPRLGQAARVMGAKPWQVFWKVSFPLLRPAILAAGLLVFLFDFTSFGVILLLGGPSFATLEVEIFIQSLQMLNLPVAALLSTIQLLCTLVFSVLYSRVAIKANAPSSQAQNTQGIARTWRSRFFVGCMLILYLTLFVLPMTALPLRSLARLDPAMGDRTTVQVAGLTLDYYRELFVNRQGSLFYVPPIDAIRNSLGYASLTVVISLLLGFPVASALARPGRLERALDPFLMLPLGASAVTLGLGYIVTFNQPPFHLLTSPWLVPLAHSTIALPFVIRSLQPALAAIPDQYRKAAAVLGASPLRTWMAVDWPVVGRASLAAGTFAFTVSLGEFGATSLLARPEYPTIPLAIYRFLSQPGGLNYGQAMAMATVLMAVTTLAILLIERLRLPGTGNF
jgi:thiamine transport system permease protein